MIEERLHPHGEDLVLVRQIVGRGGHQVAQPHLQRARVADDVGLALLVGDLFLEVPVLVGAHVDGRADVVEVQHQAGSVLAEEVRGRRGEICLRLAPLRRKLGAKHAEEGLADVADHLMLGHEDVPLPWELISRSECRGEGDSPILEEFPDEFKTGRRDFPRRDASLLEFR